MKKAAVAFLLITSLALASLLLLSGCGGDNQADKARAREFMLAGDAWMEIAETEYETVAASMEGMMDARTGDDTDVDESELENFREEIEAASESMEEPLQEARAAYQAITSLGGAADYKEYADVMLELIDEYERILTMQGTMQQGRPEMPEDWTPPTDGTSPEDMTPPEDWEPPEGQEPPEDMMPPDGGEGDMPSGGFMGSSRIDELKAEAEAIKQEKDL